MELKVLVLVLWSCSAPAQSSVIQRYYWYEPQPKTWQEAQLFCKETYEGDLATVMTDSDLIDMNLNKYYVWFGLRKMSGIWKWATTQQYYCGSLNSQISTFTVDGEETGKECGKITYSKASATAENCDQKHFVFCEDVSKSTFQETLSWLEGMNYCTWRGTRYMDIISVNSLDYNNSPTRQLRDFPVWIGLNRKDLIQNPAPGSGFCLAISSRYSQNNQMSTKECNKSYPFICYRNNLLLLKEELTWEKALETCMNLKNVYNHTSFKLLSVEEDELEYVQNYAKGVTTRKVWMGLRFLAGSWVWSDNSSLPLPSLPSCPESRCGALVFSSGSGPAIEPTDCSERLNAFCYGSGPQWS